MKQKEILVMTPFGPVPFDAVKKYFDPAVVDTIEQNKDKILASMEKAQSYHIDNILSTIIGRIAKRLGWKPQKVYNYLRELAKINTSALLTILLKEIAIVLDKNYNDHISDSKSIYCVGFLNGKVHPIDKSLVTNWSQFAAFREESDAAFAYEVATSIVNSMVESGKTEQEN